MTSSLSLLSFNAGVGFKGWPHHALAAIAESRKTASHHHLVHSEVAPPRMNKRESKALDKQTWQLIEESNEVTILPQMSEAQSEQELLSHASLSEMSHSNNEYNSKSCVQQDDTIKSNAEKGQSTRSLSEKGEPVLGLGHRQPINHDQLETQEQTSDRKVRKLSESDSLDESAVKFSKRLSAKSSSNVSVATSSNDTEDHSSLILKAHSLWEAFNGRLLSQEVLSGRGGNDGLNFECCNKHQFIISLSSLNKLKTFSVHNPVCYEIWCLKCRNFLRKAEDKARSMNSTVVSSCISQGFVAVKCENNHQFELHYTRNFAKTWCEECKIEAIQKQKEIYKQNEETEQFRKQKEQQRLFEESQKYIQQQESRSSTFQHQQEYDYYNSIMTQVSAYAKEKMERYMSLDKFKGECTHVEVFNVYKIIYMPEEILVKALWMVDQSQLKSYYRKLALILHPDKNKHELSSDAFKKLTHAYEICINKV